MVTCQKSNQKEDGNGKGETTKKRKKKLDWLKVNKNNGSLIYSHRREGIARVEQDYRGLICKIY